VDLREGSESFLRWFAVELREDTPRALFIPEGFAHGFQTLTDDVEMLYIHSAPYVPESEGGINPFDPKLAISWPLEVTVVSERDRFLPLIDQKFKGI
ncbi:MAG: dTDP-4-dehydrorhamnose 3,5-epimerase family protein, partial [candidate division WOR-3 bacterium]